MKKFLRILQELGIDQVRSLRFEHGMNILNLAIDQESVDIIEQLQKSLQDNPLLIKELVCHSYGK